MSHSSYEDEESSNEEESDEEESEEDDEDKDNNNKKNVVEDEAWNDAFMTLCLRLARNDSTLNFMNDWSKDVGLQNRGKKWKDTELLLLGKSLVHNTHLRSLSFRIESCRCRQPNAKRVFCAMQQGIAQSNLMALQMVQVCCAFQTSMLQGGVAKCASLERLEMCDEQIYNMRVLAQLLLLSSRDASTTQVSTTSLSSSLSSLHKMMSSSPPSCQLTHLGLRNCQIDNLDMLALALGLANNRTLRFLNLEKNLIGNVGIAYMCEHYWKTTTMHHHHHHDDDENNEVHAASSSSSSSSCPLQELDLTWNEIGTQGAAWLLHASTRHAALHKLLLTGNGGIGHAGLQCMGEHLAQSQLHYLELHQVVDVDMPWTDWTKPEAQAAARALADGLRHNTTLLQFHVGANVLGPPGAHAVVQAAAVHPCLHTLGYACDGSLGYPGLQLVGQALGLTRLKQIHLDGIVMPWPEDDDSHNKKKHKAARKAGLALMNGVKQNVHMTLFTLFGMNERYMNPIEFYSNVNQVCRPLFRNEAITPAVWPYILAQFYSRNHHQPEKTKTKSHLFFCLREQPWLVVVTRG